VPQYSYTLDSGLATHFRRKSQSNGNIFLSEYIEGRIFATSSESYVLYLPIDLICPVCRISFIMKLPTALSLAAVLSLQISSVLAIPIAEPVQPEGGLEKRAGTGTQSDPFILNIDCSGVTEVCEAQCVAILCFSAPQVM
jgi:hypothetical protein